MNSSNLSLLDELRNYKTKYYTNLLLKGVLVSVAILLSVYISFNFLEYLGRFSTWIRAFFFFSFLLVGSAVLVFWIIVPISKLLGINRQISDEEAATQIGKYFPEIDDKLLNTIQLNKANDDKNALIKASIEQRTRELSIVKFTDAVKYSENRKYLKFILLPLILLLLVFLISPSFFAELFTKSSARIIRFNESFAEPAPFNFILGNKKLQAFKNEDFTIELKLNGRAIPSEVFMFAGGRKYKMVKESADKYTYIFPKIQKNTDFYFDAAGYSSKIYSLDLIERPSMLAFNAFLDYPAYLGKADEKWNNIGNLVVPEGTTIQWQFNTNQANALKLIFNEGKDTVSAEKQGNKNFNYTKRAKNSETYSIRLENQYSTNKEEINYYINVIPDRYPKISMQEYQDTAAYNFISVGGNVADDYGISALKLFYRINRNGKPGNYQSVSMPVSNEQSIQNFYYQLSLQEFNLQPGDQVEYFGQVWDNDGINGSKSAKTTTLQFKIPSEEDLKNDIDESISKTSSQIDKTLQKAKQLQKDIDNLENKLMNKERLDYQDKKLAEEILKKREELAEEVRKLQEQNEMTKEKQDRFFEKSPELAEKMEQLKKLMDDLLDEETKKLYEELQKLLEQNKDAEPVLDKLKELDQKEETLEKELERALEMFKQLQFEQKMEQTTKDLKELAEDQKKLSEETENKAKDNKTLEQEQKELNEKFEEIKKDMNDLEKLDKELEEPNGMEEQNKEMEDEKQEISEEMEKSKEEIQKNQNKKAGKSQKNAGEKMQKMSEKMESMQMEMESEEMMENIEDLRAILENLVQLSYDQESVMKEFKNVNLSDPRFIQLAQKQLKLKDDAKIVEDSLNALAKRVFQIESFVTRELSQMKREMNESTEMIKQRKLSNATGKQQMAMTSMNNLALMLSDALKQMQSSMQSASSKPQKGKGKPKKSPSLGQMQQSLNQKIEDLKKGNQSGKQMSEQLAKLAAEQQRIRQALKELQKMAGSDGKLGKEQKDNLLKQLQELQKQMENTEEDLVNKRLDRIDQKRQKEIETRLLESEQAIKERGEEEQRKAEQAKEKKKTVPPALNQYFKNKEKQIELLKTIPPALSPYYKREVDKYFEKIK